MALVRHLPDSFEDALSHYYGKQQQDAEKEALSDVNLAVARAQHATYVQALQQAFSSGRRGGTTTAVYTLPQVSNCPDSVFVEDVVVSLPPIPGQCRGGLLFTTPGHDSRQGEVQSVQDFVQQHPKICQDDRLVHSMADFSSTARCDGGDVVVTDRHVFVGINNDRTNQEAVSVLQDFVNHCYDKSSRRVPEVVPVNLATSGSSTSPVLHLKSAVTYLTTNTLLTTTTATNQEWNVVGHEGMNAVARGYRVVRVPDARACNAVAVVVKDDDPATTTTTTTTILAQESPCEETRQILGRTVHEDLPRWQNQDDANKDSTTNTHFELQWINTSELAKKDGALTCCSVLL